MTHDTYDQPMNEAEAAFRALDSRPMTERCPYLFSSNYADAWWITAWSLYHTGQRPKRIRRSRGHSWIVVLAGITPRRVWVDKPDHRDGIRAKVA